MTQADLLGFLCEAFGQNKKIRKDLDRLYQLKKFDFYKYAKENDLYNSPIIKESGLAEEEYAKKALGILLYQFHHPDDREVITQLSNIAHKGWPYMSSFIDNHEAISFTKFLHDFSRKKKGMDNITDDEINTNLALLLSLSSSQGKKINHDEVYDFTLQTMDMRLKHFQGEFHISTGFRDMPLDTKNQIKHLKNIIHSEIGNVKNYQTLLKHLINDPRYIILSLLFDYDGLTASVLYDADFTNRDIDEILFTYISVYGHEEIDINHLINYYLSAIYIKSLIKMYKQVKEHYFANNKETMFFDLESVENELDKSRLESNHYKEQADKLMNSLDVAENKISKLTMELEREKRKNDELNSLRELMFSLDTKTDYDNSEEIDLDQFKGIKAVIVGGHERWQTKMKESLPDFIFIHTDMVNFDASLLESAEAVFIYTNYLSHALYYKIVDFLKGRRIKIYYLKQQNEDIVLREIYQKLIGGQKEKF